MPPKPAESPRAIPPDAGAIAGRLGFPSSGIPATLVYAISTDGSDAYSVETVGSQRTYTLVGLKPGTYFVYVTLRPVPLSPDCKSVFGAGYTKAVPCGLSVACNDHGPIPVTVHAGATTAGIDLFDWYAPVGSGFPPVPPPSVVPDGRWPIPTFGAFLTPREAIVDFAVGIYGGQLVEARTSCMINRVCMTLTDLTYGTNAAYMVAHVGSNQDVLHCTHLTFSDESGWHANRVTFCRSDRAFPAIGQSGNVNMGIGVSPTDCVHVRAQPGLGGHVLGCLRDGMPVRVDGGPAYIAPVSRDDSPDGFWWHIEGQGWMAYEYLRRSP